MSKTKGPFKECIPIDGLSGAGLNYVITMKRGCIKGKQSKDRSDVPSQEGTRQPQTDTQGCIKAQETGFRGKSTLPSMEDCQHPQPDCDASNSALKFLTGQSISADSLLSESCHPNARILPPEATIIGLIQGLTILGLSNNMTAESMNVLPSEQRGLIDALNMLTLPQTYNTPIRKKLSEARQEQEQGHSANSSFGALQLTATSSGQGRKQESSLQGCMLVPCRSRGMPMDHNSQTAFFEISENTKHGSSLVCSHVGCRQRAGIKFLFCSHCGIPVAKKTFWARHNHSEQAAQLKDDGGRDSSREPSNGTAVNSSLLGSSPQQPTPRMTKRVETIESKGKRTAKLQKAPEKPTKRAKVRQTSHSQQVDYGVPDSQASAPFPATSSSSSTNSANHYLAVRNEERAPSRACVDSRPSRSKGVPNKIISGNLSNRCKKEWASLLCKRPPIESSNEFLVWLVQVISVSERCNHSEKSDVSSYSSVSSNSTTSSSHASFTDESPFSCEHHRVTE